MRNCDENTPSNQIELYGFIYLTTNLVNGKKYIGKRKYKRNSTDDDNYLVSGKLIKQAIDKYGKENFVRDTLDYAYSKNELSDKEQYYIALYNAVEDDMFYNLKSGGDGGVGTKEQIDHWVECMKRWRLEHPDEYLASQQKASMWRSDKDKVEQIKKKVGEKNRVNTRKYYEEHPDEWKQRYPKIVESLKEYYREHPEEDALRRQKILDKQHEKMLFPIVCIERNEIYVAMWHAKHLIKRTAENIKRHLEGMYRWCGKDPETGVQLHWRIATVEDLDNIPFAKGGEAHEQLCRELLSNSAGQAV